MKLVWKRGITASRAWRGRAVNRWHDLLAVSAGYCNVRSNPSGLPGGGGGYLHWRCALKRHHGGWHRFRNYRWHGQQIEFAPVPSPPAQPWDRAWVRTARQARRLDRWHAVQQAAMRARREAAR